MTKKKTRGRPSKNPEEALVEWHLDLHWLVKVVGVDWFHENLRQLNTRKGREKLRKQAGQYRDESSQSIETLKNTPTVSQAHECSIKWVKAQADQLRQEAEAIEFLADGFEHGLPKLSSDCLLDILLEVAVTVKCLHGEDWRTVFLDKLPTIDFAKHKGLGSEGIVVLPLPTMESSPDYSNFTFADAVIDWIFRHSGYKPSKRTFFRGLKQHGLGAK